MTTCIFFKVYLKIYQNSAIVKKQNTVLTHSFFCQPQCKVYFICFSLLGDNVSQHGSNISTTDGQLEHDDHLRDAGRETTIYIPSLEGNGVFHDICLILHLLQMKGLFRDQAYKDTNIYLKKFIVTCNSFEIAHISLESI